MNGWPRWRGSSGFSNNSISRCQVVTKLKRKPTDLIHAESVNRVPLDAVVAAHVGPELRHMLGDEGAKLVLALLREMHETEAGGRFDPRAMLGLEGPAAKQWRAERELARRRMFARDARVEDR